MAQTRFQVIEEFINNMPLPDQGNEQILEFLAGQADTKAALPTINTAQYQARFGLTQGELALEETANTTGVNLVTVARKRIIAHRASNLTMQNAHNAAHLRAIAECEGLPAVAAYMQKNAAAFGVGKGAPIARDVLPPTVIADAQKKVISHILFTLNDLTHLKAIANCATPQDVVDYIHTKKDYFGIAGTATITTDELPATAIADAQVKVINATISDFSPDSARLQALAQCKNAEAVMDEINDNLSDYNLHRAITNAALIPTGTIQHAQKEVLKHVLLTLKDSDDDLYQAIIKCRTNAELARVINADKDGDDVLGLAGGPDLRETEIPADVVAKMQNDARDEHLSHLADDIAPLIQQHPIYSRDESITDDPGLSLLIPESKAEPGEPIPNNVNLNKHLNVHIENIVNTHKITVDRKEVPVDHLTAIKTLFAMSPHGNEYLEPGKIAAFLATLYNPVMDAKDIDKKIRTELKVKLGPNYGDTKTNAGRTNPEIDRLIESIAKCNEDVRNAFKASFVQEVALTTPAAGGPPTTPFKFYVGTLKSEDEFNCISKASVGEALTHAFNTGAKKQDIAFAVMPKAPAHTEFPRRDTKGPGQPQTRTQISAEDQNRGQTILAFFQFLEKDTQLTKKGKKRSPFCIRGTWNLQALLQTMECCLANGKTFDFADAVSQLHITNGADRKPLFEFYKGQDPNVMNKAIDDLIASEQTRFRHKPSVLATQLISLKEMMQANVALGRSSISTPNGNREPDVQREYMGRLESTIARLNGAPNNFNLDQLKTQGNRSYEAFRQTAGAANVGVIAEAQLSSGDAPPRMSPGR